MLFSCQKYRLDISNRCVARFSAQDQAQNSQTAESWMRHQKQHRQHSFPETAKQTNVCTIASVDMLILDATSTWESHC